MPKTAKAKTQFKRGTPQAAGLTTASAAVAARRKAKRGAPLTKRILALVRKHPGLTATQVATKLRERVGGVASILSRAAVTGHVSRRLSDGPNKPWCYFPISHRK